MKMRAVGVTVLSLTLTAAVIGNAYYHKQQFYPSVVYITRSNPSMFVMYIQASILVYLSGKLMRKLFFGELRAAEFEHLMERSWYAITETCLAFTVFRDDFSPKFVALFTLLLFLKCFHWLAEDRVDFMERSPVISLLFHIRILSLIGLLGALDSFFIRHAYLSTVTKGASVQLVFGFEYAILATVVVNIGIKYILHTVDINSETPWENKAVFLLYTELIMGLLKVFLYVTFVVIMIRLYTLPLFAFRPMYYAMRKFRQAYNDVILSRRAIQNMNTLYPDATPEELAAADNVCIICREEMTTASKKLPCNHIFHTACLRSWFQRQQTCPTCRLNILRPTPQPAAEQQQQQQGPPAAAPAAAGAPPLPPRPPFPLIPGLGVFGMAMGGHGAPDQRIPQPPQQNDPMQPGVRPQHDLGASPPPPVSPLFYPPMPLWSMMPPMPPLPPDDFSGLSDEELQRMEGTARENVLARLQCLRQIELLLSATSTVMHQYLAVYNTASLFPSGAFSEPTASTSGTTNVTPETAGSSSGGVTESEVTEKKDVPSTSSSTSLPESSEEKTDTLSPQEEELKKLRSKRLEKLEGTN